MYVQALIDLSIALDGVDDPDDFPSFDGGQIAKVLDKTDDDTEVKIAFFTGKTKPFIGWIFAKIDGEDVVKIVPEPPRPDFDTWAFVKASIDAERWVKEKEGDDANFFVLGDYLIALALIETKIKNDKNKNPLTDGVGPFQLSSEDWKIFTDDNDYGGDYDEFDREEPLEQISGAAFLALRAMKAISAAIAQKDKENGQDETSGETGPYIPSYVDVLLAHMIGLEAAIAVRQAKFAKRDGDPVADILKEFYPDSGNLDKLFEHRAVILKDASGNKRVTVDGALMRTQSLLGKKFKEAFALIKTHTPEHLPDVSGTAPWYTIAETEYTAWKDTHKKEDTQSGTARVKDYLGAINFSTAKVVPWCGAFAGYCMVESGPPFDSSVVSGPARAANWRTWGNVDIPLGRDDVPQGAVVVLAPEKGSARSGHVGFFSSFLNDEKDIVQLLGGNQSDMVTLTKFSRDKIVAIRWHSAAEAQAQAASDGEFSGASIDKFAPLLDLIGSVESNNNYNAYYSKASNKTEPQLTGMKIRDVIAWQRDLTTNKQFKSSAAGKYQIIRKTLRSLVEDKNVNASLDDVFDEAMQDKLALSLLERRKLGRFLSGHLRQDDMMINLAQEWASFPVPKDMRGHKNRAIEEGQSYYAGDKLNKALTTVPVVRNALRAIS